MAALLSNPGIAAHQPRASGRAILPTIYRLDDRPLAMFSTHAQFRAAEEVAVSDMKIELMFPADAAAEAVFASPATA